MHSDSDHKINELTADLEDLKVTVEELQIDPSADIDPKSLENLKDALEQASAATDELEDQEEEAGGPLGPKE